MGKREIAIIIPCYNESSAIADVLQNLHQFQPEAQLIVVNDASQDNSAKIVSDLAATRDYIVLLDLPVNLGIGGAVQTGLCYAKRHEFTYAVKFDGDGQHPAEAIDALLAPLKNGTADFSIGSRFLENEGFQSTASRRVGITIFRVLISALTGQRITDNTSGFRGYNRTAIGFAAEHYPNFDYPEPEEVVLMARNHFRMQEVPVVMKARQGGVSSITPFRAVYYMIKVVFAVLMSAIRPCERKN